MDEGDTSTAPCNYSTNMACPVTTAWHVIHGLAQVTFPECVRPSESQALVFFMHLRLHASLTVATDAQSPTASWQLHVFHTSIFKSLGNK